MTLLSVQDLTMSYGHRPLFAGLSLDFRAGERVGLVGPNGAGKSPLLRLMAGREGPDAGTRSVRRGARVGYVAQDDVFAPGETVRAVLLSALAEGPVEGHERERRAAAMLTRMGFTDADRPADALSGGWRWRASWSASPTCCCWTSRPTTSTSRASCGWRPCCARRRLLSSWSATTAISWRT